MAGSVSAGSDSAAENGNVAVPLLQCPELVALPSQQGSVFTTLKAHLRIGTWVAQWHQAMSPLVQPGLHTSPYLWQKSAGHSLLSPGGASSTPGIDCPRGGNTVPPFAMD